ncbi:MAG TPA: glycosyltransferase [Candidatus Binataceae bacterium]|nr:glycosyltransferase [Candidatus Binataceae bacterium]
MKILHVTPYFIPARSYGGPVESVYRLCLGVASAGCEVRVLTTNSDGIGRSLAVDSGRLIAVAAGLEVRYLPRWIRHAVAPSMLLRLLPEVKRVDVVHLTGVYSFPTIPTLLAAAILRKPLVWSPRGALQRWAGSRRVALKRLWEAACKPLAGHRTILHVTSEQEQIESHRRFRRLATVTIPNGVRLPLEAAFQPGDGSLRMGFIGRLDPKKGIENLLSACAAVKANGTSFTLTIAGGGPEHYSRALKTQTARLRLDTEVQFIGEVHNHAKRAFFESINLLVVPSHTENFAQVVAEALASGIPVIASHGTPWAAVEEKGCGLWVANSPAELARAIQQMRDAPLASMGSRGREWMASDFSWSAAARAMCNTYSSLAYGKRWFGLGETKAAADSGRAA